MEARLASIAVALALHAQHVLTESKTVMRLELTVAVLAHHVVVVDVATSALTSMTLKAVGVFGMTADPIAEEVETTALTLGQERVL